MVVHDSLHSLPHGQHYSLGTTITSCLQATLLLFCICSPYRAGRLASPLPTGVPLS